MRCSLLVNAGVALAAGSTEDNTNPDWLLLGTFGNHAFPDKPLLGLGTEGLSPPPTLARKCRIVLVETSSAHDHDLHDRFGTRGSTARHGLEGELCESAGDLTSGHATAAVGSVEPRLLRRRRGSAHHAHGRRRYLQPPTCASTWLHLLRFHSGRQRAGPLQACSACGPSAQELPCCFTIYVRVQAACAGMSAASSSARSLLPPPLHTQMAAIELSPASFIPESSRSRIGDDESTAEKSQSEWPPYSIQGLWFALRARSRFPCCVARALACKLCINAVAEPPGDLPEAAAVTASPNLALLDVATPGLGYRWELLWRRFLALPVLLCSLLNGRATAHCAVR